MADTPNLNKGESEVDINAFNVWLRGTPQYQELLKSWGQDPGHPHNLSDSQKTQITRTAQALGAKVDESNEEVDDNGNFRNVGHKLRNTLIVAGIAAAALVTAGAAGAFGGAALGGAEGAGAAGAGGAAAAGEGGVLASTALPGMGALATGAAASGAVPAALAAGEVAAGVGGAAGIGGAVADAAGSAGATGAADAAATGAGEFVGPTQAMDSSLFMGPTQAAGDVAGGSGSTLSSLAKGIPSTLQALGKGVGDATTAAGNNALNQEQLGLQANNSNIAGQSAFENELINRAKTEATQRQGALADVYRQSYATNGGTGSGPRVSPYNPAGSPAQSPEYLAALKNLQGQGSKTLANPAAYSTTAMPTLNPYKPIDPANVQGATNTKPSALQTAGEWVSPALSTLSALSKYWGS